MDRPSARIESLSAVTLSVGDIGRSMRFYESLGFTRKPGVSVSGFASYVLGDGAQPAYLNLIEAADGPARAPGSFGGWGRVIVYVSDVDAFHAQVLALGLAPEFAPADAPWGERYFHLLDPDGHELSFAKLLSPAAGGVV
jgi:catechol 2,3-dioxygenase-like lactoylglutathione lyase family enzyme